MFSLLVCALNVHRPAGAAGLALLLGSVLLPLHPTPPRWAARFLARSVAELRAYFPINVIYEDEAAFASNKPGSPTPGPFVVGACLPQSSTLLASRLPPAPCSM